MKRNCLFILVDCLRADKCWGNKRTAKTPTIDSLCQRGTTFTQAIATTTTTTPSVSSILTGLYPFSHGVRSLHGYKLKPSVKTLPQILAENGYHTYAEVTGPLLPQIGIGKGFEHYQKRSRSDNIYSSWGAELLGKFRNREFEEPWFIFLHLFELHLPRLLPSKYNKHDFGANRYERALSSLDAQLAQLMRCIDDNTIIIFHADHGEKIAQTMLQEHAMGLAQYPLSMGRKLRLKRPSRLLLSGHGFHVYDYLVRVPLIFIGKGAFPENRQIPQQVRQIDIASTILDALELGHPGSCVPHAHLPVAVCGRSLLPLISNSESWEEIPAYCEALGKALNDMTEWIAAIRTSRYKYICRPYSNHPREEFYDLQNDPQERRNLVADRPEVVQGLRKELRKIRRAGDEDQIRQRVTELKEGGRLHKPP